MAARKHVCESQDQTGILRFFKDRGRDKGDQSNSGDGEQGDSGELCYGEEVVQVADLIPANFPEQDLDIGILIKPNTSSVEISSALALPRKKSY